MSKLMVGILVIGLVASLLLCATAAYWGYGVTQVGARHIRTASVSGPSVVGGGPGVGK